MVNIDEATHISYPPESEPLSSIFTGTNGETPSSIVGIVRFSSPAQEQRYRESSKLEAEKVIQELASEARFPSI